MHWPIKGQTKNDYREEINARHDNGANFTAMLLLCTQEYARRRRLTVLEVDSRIATMVALSMTISQISRAT
jgi:hypothetical protein